jgi:SAM-dependent methyltransferase
VNDATEQFIQALREALAEGTFVKLSLSNYKGREEHLQKMMARIVETKKGRRLFLQYKFTTRDVVKTHDLAEGIEIVARALKDGFRNGHLFTSESDLQLDIGKRSSRLNVGKPTFRTPPSAEHDRKKKRLIDQDAFYLKALGITSDSGEVMARQHDKWKQINKFVEILAGIYEASDLREKERLKILDMGSGKGYLTFAAYDYFSNVRGISAEVTGIERRTESVRLCNNVANASGFEGLTFVEGEIAGHDVHDADVLIALHACDTATDDAIHAGIRGRASIILVAPCCHREVRARMKPPSELAGVLRHHLMLDRIAELLTDGIRSLVLEKEGYATRMFEFVGSEHTPKNTMITARRQPRTSPDAAEQLREITERYGIAAQRLLDLTQTKKGPPQEETP